MNVLFDAITESDLSSIKNNIRTLLENLAENLSLLNVTRLEVSQNRQAIKKGLHSIDLKHDNITEAIEGQLKKLETYVQLDLIILC